MVLLLLMLAVLLIGLAAAVLLGRLPAPGVLPPVTTESFTALPEPAGPADVEELRFDVAARGYRMAQVDRVLVQLQRELARRDEEIARLRAGREEQVDGDL